MSREKTTGKTSQELTAEEKKTLEELAKKEQQAAQQLIRQKKIAARLDALSINWTSDHTVEFMRLVSVISQKPLKISDAEYGTQELARIMPAWPKYDGNISDISTMKAQYKHALNVIEAFREEWAHVADDRGEQKSLFCDTAQELTDDQRAAWANYYEMDADARRFYLLVAASKVMFLLEVKNSQTRNYLPRTEQTIKPYFATYGSLHANAVTQITPRTPRKRDNISQTKTINIETSGKWGAYIVRITNNCDLEPSAIKLLDYCTFLFAQQNNFQRFKTKEEREAYEPKTGVLFELDDYLTVCGKKVTKDNKKDELKRMKRDADAIFNTTIEGLTINGDKVYCRICDTRMDFKNGAIGFNFGKTYAQMLVSSFTLFVPRWIFAIGGQKYRYYSLAKKLALHYGMDSNRKAGNYNRISVAALFADTNIFPEYDTNKDRHSTRFTYELLEEMLTGLSDIAHIQGSSFTWSYCDKNGVKTEPPDGHGYKRDNDITFEFPGYPDPTPRLQARAKEKASKEKRRQRAIAANTKKRRSKQQLAF